MVLYHIYFHALEHTHEMFFPDSLSSRSLRFGWSIRKELPSHVPRYEYTCEFLMCMEADPKTVLKLHEVLCCSCRDTQAGLSRKWRPRVPACTVVFYIKLPESKLTVDRPLKVNHCYGV